MNVLSKHHLVAIAAILWLSITKMMTVWSVLAGQAGSLPEKAEMSDPQGSLQIKWGQALKGQALKLRQLLVGEEANKGLNSAVSDIEECLNNLNT